MSVRKAHNSGRNHLRNVVEYYQQIGHEKAQSVIDSITSSYAAEGQASSNPMLQAPGGLGGFAPPFGFPGGMPAFPMAGMPAMPGMPGMPGLPGAPLGNARGMPAFPPPGGLPFPPPFPPGAFPGSTGGMPPFPIPGQGGLPPPGGMPNFPFPPIPNQMNPMTSQNGFPPPGQGIGGAPGR